MSASRLLVEAAAKRAPVRSLAAHSFGAGDDGVGLVASSLPLANTFKSDAGLLGDQVGGGPGQWSPDRIVEG